MCFLFHHYLLIVLFYVNRAVQVRKKTLDALLVGKEKTGVSENSSIIFQS